MSRFEQQTLPDDGLAKKVTRFSRRKELRKEERFNQANTSAWTPGKHAS